MYNRVLQKYTENISEQSDSSITSSTLHSWINGWWRSHKIEKLAEDTSASSENKKNVYLKCPYHENQKVKDIGAKWSKQKKQWYVSADSFQEHKELLTQWIDDSTVENEDNLIYLQASYKDRLQVKNLGAKFNSSLKKWYVTQELLDNNLSAFNPWLPSTKTDYSAPEIERFVYDWETMQDQLMEKDTFSDWGHLIIDEAQDFSPEMYEFLYFAGRMSDNGDLTILADENQRLHEGSNSSLYEIEKKLRIKTNRIFSLTKNFRNTIQIAKLSREFYTGLPSGKPDLPSRNGETPKLISTGSREKQAIYMANFLQSKGAGEVGVIVQDEKMRDFFYQQLKQKLENDYKVQTYSSSQPRDSANLQFDNKGTLTVLNRHSCKGLEFDIVFIPEIQDMPVDDNNLDVFKMNMYVMCSRAREELIILRNNKSCIAPDVMQYLPSVDTGLLDYMEQ